MTPKPKPTKTKTLPFDFGNEVPTADASVGGALDPLVQRLWGVTEREFMAMFEVPTGPEKK